MCRGHTENYDDVIINRPRSQAVTGEMHRTTFFFKTPFACLHDYCNGMEKAG